MIRKNQDILSINSASDKQEERAKGIFKKNRKIGFKSTLCNAHYFELRFLGLWTSNSKCSKKERIISFRVKKIKSI